MKDSKLKILHSLGVSSKTIKRDFIDQGIETWSSISNDELIDQIIQIIEIEHKAVGISIFPRVLQAR